MDNLTIDKGVIKKDHNGLAPLEGYHVVIYEKLDGGGAEYLDVLEPGDRFRRSKILWPKFIWSERNYFAIAVSMSPDLLHQFKERFRLDDQIHEFDLDVDLHYRVTDSTRIANARDADPLRQLCDRIIREIRRLIVQQAWEKIRDAFRTVEQEVVSRAEKIIRDPATALGFAVQSIALHLQLLEQDIQGERARAVEAAKRIRLSEEQETQRQMSQFERGEKLGDAITNGSATAIQNVGQNIDTPSELMEGVRVGQELSSALGRTTGHANQGYSGTLPLGRTERPAVLGRGKSWLESLMGTLADIDEWDYPVDQRRALISAILHLVAELARDNDANIEQLERYANDIFIMARAFDPPLSAGQNRLVASFKNYAQLRGQFQ